MERPSDALSSFFGDGIRDVFFTDAPIGCMVVRRDDGVIIASNQRMQEIAESPLPLSGIKGRSCTYDTLVPESVSSQERQEYADRFFDDPSKTAITMGNGWPVPIRTMSGNIKNVVISIAHVVWHGDQLALVTATEVNVEVGTCGFDGTRSDRKDESVSGGVGCHYGPTSHTATGSSGK